MSRAASTPKEWALAIGGGLVLAAGLVLVLRGGGDEPPAVVPLPPPAAAAQSPPVPVAPAPPPADLSLVGLRAGPDGGMAIIAAGGRQYLLRPGAGQSRTLPGGLQLRRVEPGRAILSGPAGEVVLAFADAAATARPAGPPGGDPTPWRLALRPLKGAGRAIDGWRLDTLAGLPALARAGLQPGDVLLAAGGIPLISEEKIVELPQELASNGSVTLTVRRGGSLRDMVVTP